MKKKILLMTMVFTLAVAMAAGCGKKEDTTKKATMKTADKKTADTKKIEKKEVLKVVGEKTETSFEVKLTNNASQDITGIAVKSSDDQTYPENMLKNADKFTKAESRIVYYTPTKAKEAVTETGKAIPVEYSIQLTFADGTVSELHAFPFEDIKEGKISLEEKIAYVTYTSEASKQEVVTLEAEKAVRAQADAAAAEKAKAEADAAAAKAAADAAAQAAAQVDTTPQYQPEAPAAPEPVAPAPEPEAPAPEPIPDAGADEGCLDDGLFY